MPEKTQSPEVSQAESHHEIIERAGNRSNAEMGSLLRDVRAIMSSENRFGQGRIHHAETIDDIEAGNLDHFQEGGVGFRKLETGTIICASDAHGDFDSISGALEAFIERVESGEDVYFNFSGDMATSDTDNNRLRIMEAVYAAKAKYPERVMIETGNGDRGNIAFFIGPLAEIMERELDPEEFQQILGKAESFKQEYIDEMLAKAEDPTIEPKEAEKFKGLAAKADKAVMTKHMFLGALMMNEATLTGNSPALNQEFLPKFIYAVIKHVLGLEKQTSAVLNKHIIRPLIEGTTKPSWHAERQTVLDPEKIRSIVSTYNELAGVVENVPVANIIRTPQGNLLLEHGSPVGIDRIGDLTYDRLAGLQSSWTKFKPELEAYDWPDPAHLPTHGKADLHKWLEKNNVLLMQCGHNHGNRIDDMGDNHWRMEVATTKRAHSKDGEGGVLEEPAYGEINLANLSQLKEGKTDGVISFHSVEKSNNV